MDKKNLVICGLAVFVVRQVLDYLIHGVILAGAYEATFDLWRPDAEMASLMPAMFAGGLFWSFVFAYIFSWARRGPGLMEGVRFGCIIGLFVTVPILGNYVVMPIPGSLALSWFAFGMIQVVICGAVLSLVFRPSTKAK